MDPEFITKKPKNPLLQETISYYYFHQSSNLSHPKKFIYYPNFKNALTIYKHSSITYKAQHSTSQPDANVDFSFLYSGIQKQFRTAEIIPPFDKIGIVFQELGINHFIHTPLNTITNHSIDKSFNYFGDDLKHVCANVYNTSNIDEKVKLLDAFFLKTYIPFKNERLKTSVDHIISSQKTTVKEVAKHCKISEKTLVRLFKAHLCCTPKTYIDVVQFRKALNDYLLLNKNLSLTELALDNEYYDQAQFIHHFKKLSGVTPKHFFKSIKHLGYEDTFWTFN